MLIVLELSCSRKTVETGLRPSPNAKILSRDFPSLHRSAAVGLTTILPFCQTGCTSEICHHTANILQRTVTACLCMCLAAVGFFCRNTLPFFWTIFSAVLQAKSCSEPNMVLRHSGAVFSHDNTKRINLESPNLVGLRARRELLAPWCGYAKGGSRRWSWGAKSEGLGTEVPEWGPGAKPRQGVWGTESPRSWSILKIHNLNFKALWKWKA